MTSHNDDRPEPDAALLIECGVAIPPEQVATIATMRRAAAAGRNAIRALRLGETEPATIFVPPVTDTEGTDE